MFEGLGGRRSFKVCLEGMEGVWSLKIWPCAGLQILTGKFVGGRCFVVNARGTMTEVPDTKLKYIWYTR